MSDLVRGLYILVLSTWLALPAGYAHDLITESVDESVVQSILHGVHEETESGDPHATFLSEVASKFDFPGFARQMVRSYLVHRESNETHAANVAFLLGASHTMETSSGPVYFLIGIINGHSYEILIPTTTALLSQALPGIDFMCFVLGGTYAASEDFRDLTTQGRIHFVRGAGGAGRFLGINEFFKTLVQREPVLNFLNSRGSRLPTRVDLAPDYVRPTDRYARRGAALERLRHSRQLRLAEAVSVNFEDSGRASLNLLDEQGRTAGILRGTQTEGGRFIVHSLDLHSTVFQSTSAVERERWGAQLGWNVRDVLSTVHRRLQNSPARDLASAPYIDRVEKIDSNRVEIFRKEAAHAAGGCADGHCHHDHHARGVEVQQLVLLMAPPKSEPDLSIHFVHPAIQIGLHTEFHKWAAIKSIPRLVWGTALRSVKFIVLSPVWGTKALIRFPAFAWNVLLQSPSAIRKSGRIVSQLTLNSGRGALSVAQTLGRGLRATPHALVTAAELSRELVRRAPAALAVGVRQTPALLTAGGSLLSRSVDGGLRRAGTAVRVSYATCAWKMEQLARISDE